MRDKLSCQKKESAIQVSPHEDACIWLQRRGWTRRGSHVHCVTEIGLITVKSGGAAKSLQLALQCNVIIIEEVEEERHFNAASGTISTKKKKKR